MGLVDDLIDDTAEVTASCAAGDWHADGAGAAEVRRIAREGHEHTLLGREHAVAINVVLGGDDGADDFRNLLEQSSFGTPGARQLRERAGRDVIGEVRRRL
jgi:hypothetical protein